MSFHINKSLIVSLLITFGMILVGCADPEDDHEESQDAHVCEHLVDGPSASLTAMAALEDALDAVNADNSYRVQAQLHTRYDVTFPADTTGSYSGYIPYLPIVGDGDYVLYADAAVNITILNHSEDNAVVTPETVMDHSDDCPSVAFKGIYHLHSEDVYLIQVTGAPDALIGMLFPAFQGEDDDHDH